MDDSLWEFARFVRIRYPSDTPSHQLQPIIRQWFDLAKPKLRDYAFADAVAHFLKVFPLVEEPADQSPLLRAQLLMDQYVVPNGYLEGFEDSPDLDRLARVCYVMSECSGGTFFLSARDAAKLIGVSRMTAHTRLKLLVDLNLLEVVHPGIADPARGLAAEYRWVGPDLIRLGVCAETESGGMDLRAEVDPSSLG